MRITQGQLRQIIKEEIARKLDESRVPGGRSYHPLYRTDAAGFPLRSFGEKEYEPRPRLGLPAGHKFPGPGWHIAGTGYSDEVGAAYFDRQTRRLLEAQETCSGSVYAQSPGVPADASYTLTLSDSGGYVANVATMGDEISREGRSDVSPYDAIMQAVEELFF